METKKVKMKTKAMALAICLMFLTAMSGAIMVGATEESIDAISIDEKSKELTEVDELNSFPPLITAIDKGTAWLASKQNSDGSWGTDWPVAKTGLAVLKFETHALELGISPFDPVYNYSDEIETGLDYIFANAHIARIGPQIHGAVVHDPDTDGDGIGVYFISLEEGAPIYETGIVAMAIAATTTPTRIVTVPGSPVDGWTYQEVLQDVVDYLAWAQTDSGYGRGGWNYEPMDNEGDRSDQSNSGWVTLGLAYAEKSPPLGFGLHVPGFVRKELNIWIDYIQNKVSDDPDYGGAGYETPMDWVNILKTGNLLQQMAWVGDTNTSPRVQNAIDYLVNHWNEPPDPGWRGDPSCYHATYTVMKGLESLHIDTIDSINWYWDFAIALLAEQLPEGSWPVSMWDDGEQILSIEWVLLTLEKVVVPPPEKPDLVIEGKDEMWVDQEKGTYKVYFIVGNRGNVVAPAGHEATLYVDGTEIEHKMVLVDLAPGETYGDYFDTIITLSEGSDKIKVCADNGEVIDELNEINNCLTNMYPEVGKPDLAIKNKGENWVDEEKGTYKVYFIIHNKGEVVAKAGHETTLYVDGAEIEHKKVLVDLKPHETYQDYFDKVLTLSGDSDEIKVCADNSDLIDELNEKNNCRTNVWERPKPEIWIETDKFKYCSCNTMDVRIEIFNPTDRPVIFKWFLGIPQFDFWMPVYKEELPPYFEDTIEESLHIGEWSKTPFSAVWYVDLQDPKTGDELAADCACWSYSPWCGPVPPKEMPVSMPTTPSLSDIATEIGEEIEGIV